MTKIDWTNFNELKKKAWKTNSQDEWDQVKAEYRTMFERYDEETRPYFKEKTAQQLADILEKKKPQWGRPKFAPKESYIFREEEGKAFIALATALADYLNRH